MGTPAVGDPACSWDDPALPRAPYISVLRGTRRAQAIAEFLAWLDDAQRHPPEDRVRGTPLAEFVAEHDRQAARHRSLSQGYYKQTNRREHRMLARREG